MYRVLMPVDTDEDRALAQAQYVAGLPDAKNSVEAIIVFVFHGEGQELPEELKQFQSASRVASVRRVSEFLEDRGVEVTLRDDSGDTADDILAVADEFDVDSIVLGTRKRSPIGKAIFGSVTQSVILDTDRHVVVAGDDRE